MAAGHMGSALGEQREVSAHAQLAQPLCVSQRLQLGMVPPTIRFDFSLCKLKKYRKSRTDTPGGLFPCSF